MTASARCLGLLVCAAVGLAAAEVTAGGVTLDLPEGMQAVEDPPAGALAAWRSEDGTASIAIATQPGEQTVDAAFVDAQVAQLARHAQDFELLRNEAVELAGRPWHRLRYRLDLGPLRFEQDARLTALDDPVDPAVLVVTASWPLTAAETWADPLTTALDGIAHAR